MRRDKTAMDIGVRMIMLVCNAVDNRPASLKRIAAYAVFAGSAGLGNFRTIGYILS
jgi:hypothetical protein